MNNWMEYTQFAAADALAIAPCPSCHGYWFQDVDECGLPYSCFRCGNDSIQVRKYEAEEEVLENTYC